MPKDSKFMGLFMYTDSMFFSFSFQRIPSFVFPPTPLTPPAASAVVVGVTFNKKYFILDMEIYPLMAGKPIEKVFSLHDYDFASILQSVFKDVET